MTAKFTIIKYTGKDSDFGTEVSSIGIKRVDAAVPAVYGNPVVPGNDISDAAMYSVYRPDDVTETAYSFESIFKLKLITKPDNQLSNVRIYPEGEIPTDTKLPKLFIGCSQNGYTRPTNNKSIIATHNIWDFTKDSPFNVTVGGVSGTALDPQIAYGVFNISIADIGQGNVIYLNNERQDTIQLVEPRTGHPNRSYTFLDRSTGGVIFKIYNPLDNTLVTHPSITTGVDGYGRSFTTIIADSALLTSYPNGLLYGSDTNISVGGLMEWIDLDGDPITTEIHEVDVRIDNFGKSYFYIDGTRQCVINFDLNKIYVFNNHSGDTHPLRFINNNSTRALESNIVINGVSVQNGGTINEIITVDPRVVKNDGFVITAYQSVNGDGIGASITNTQTYYEGYYNLNTVGAGTNPTAAGETDYIYLQLEVKGDSTVGNFIPSLAIEYDEN
jgi:hypothetical protein